MPSVVLEDWFEKERTFYNTGKHVDTMISLSNVYVFNRFSVSFL